MTEAAEPEAGSETETPGGAQDDGESDASGLDDEPVDVIESSPAPPRPERDLRFGVATAAGLSTMTPVARVTEAPHRELGEAVLRVEGLTKAFGTTVAVRDVSLEVRKGSFFGIVGPNGAGKTTTLSMVTGLLRPTSGSATVLGVDVWRASAKARSHIGILPDRLRLFDQLTGAQLLYYTGVLRGLPADEARARAASLIDTFELSRSASRLVVDYSAGMTKKVALASALIHSPDLLVLDEPFESIDPVSAGQLTDILFEYVDRGGTVMLSSHSMDLVQRVCDHVAVIVDGEILADGTVAEVRGDVTLEERFRDIVRGPRQTEGLDWLGISFS
ncbi:ABC transporter ATP-binding protein [Pseudoclavibacter endophyticus]|uniref:ABC transporter ATP-binding protein n=1 Tax=Pseudoclavibacter endophyticus TaxID=1778590 RepID=A0A6H9WSD2_9MICO|nr:ABC transporter ATP-binding protein [Pseudoclavibacter endophyticus]